MAIVTGFDPSNASDNILALYRAIRKISSGSSLPSQTGNNGKFLSTDGVDASWITLTGGGNMTTSTYDPTGVSGDAFDYNNFFNTPTIPTTPTLADVLDVGNTSGLNDIVFDEFYGLLFDNNSRLREGTIPALGSNKGIAQICGAGYELKWANGILYVMGSSGNTIRQSLYNFSTTPTVTDDDTLGYGVGSLWTLDNGVTYRCSDATTGSAVWDIASSGDFITLSKADWQTLITNNLVIPNQGYYVTDAIDGGGLWATAIGAKFIASDFMGKINGSVYFVEIQSWGEGAIMDTSFTTNDMFIYDFVSYFDPAQVTWIVTNGLPSNYFKPYTRVLITSNSVIPSGIGYGNAIETNVYDDATGISLNACRTIGNTGNPSVPCIYDEPTGNAYITSITFKKILTDAALLVTGDYDINELPAPPSGYAWRFLEASVFYEYGTVAYDTISLSLGVDTASKYQFDDLGLLAGTTGDGFYPMPLTIPTNSNPSIIEAKKGIVNVAGSTQGDGVVTIYGTARLITL